MKTFSRTLRSGPGSSSHSPCTASEQLPSVGAIIVDPLDRGTDSTEDPYHFGDDLPSLLPISKAFTPSPMPGSRTTTAKSVERQEVAVHTRPEPLLQDQQAISLFAARKAGAVGTILQPAAPAGLIEPVPRRQSPRRHESSAVEHEPFADPNPCFSSVDAAQSSALAGHTSPLPAVSPHTQVLSPRSRLAISSSCRVRSSRPQSLSTSVPRFPEEAMLAAGQDAADPAPASATQVSLHAHSALKRPCIPLITSPGAPVAPTPLASPHSLRSTPVGLHILRRGRSSSSPQLSATMQCESPTAMQPSGVNVSQVVSPPVTLTQHLPNFVPGTMGWGDVGVRENGMRCQPTSECTQLSGMAGAASPDATCETALASRGMLHSSFGEAILSTHVSAAAAVLGRHGVQVAGSPSRQVLQQGVPPHFRTTADLISSAHLPASISHTATVPSTVSVPSSAAGQILDRPDTSNFMDCETSPPSPVHVENATAKVVSTKPAADTATASAGVKKGTPAQTEAGSKTAATASTTAPERGAVSLPSCVGVASMAEVCAFTTGVRPPSSTAMTVNTAAPGMQMQAHLQVLSSHPPPADCSSLSPSFRRRRVVFEQPVAMLRSEQPSSLITPAPVLSSVTVMKKRRLAPPPPPSGSAGQSVAQLQQHAKLPPSQQQQEQQPWKQQQQPHMTHIYPVQTHVQQFPSGLVPPLHISSITSPVKQTPVNALHSAMSSPRAAGRSKSPSLTASPVPSAVPARKRSPSPSPGMSVAGLQSSPGGQPLRNGVHGWLAHSTNNSSAANSVSQAQERGEQQQLQDDALYALDGLRAGANLATQRESAVTLATILSTRRGRAALRADSLAQQVLTAAAKLKGVADPDLAAAFSVMLLCLGSEDANPSYLASAAAAVLMSQLLQVDHVWSIATGGHRPSSTAAFSGGVAPSCSILSAPVTDVHLSWQAHEKQVMQLLQPAALTPATCHAPPPLSGPMQKLWLSVVQGPLAAELAPPWPFIKSPAELRQQLEAQQRAQGDPINPSTSFTPPSITTPHLSTQPPLPPGPAASRHPSTSGMRIPASGSVSGISRLATSTSPPPTSHLPVLLVCMLHATSTRSHKAQFSERVKANLLKVGALDKLGKLVEGQFRRLRAAMSLQLPSLQPSAPESAAVDQKMLDARTLCDQTMAESGQPEAAVAHELPSVMTVHGDGFEGMDVDTFVRTEAISLQTACPLPPVQHEDVVVGSSEIAPGLEAVSNVVYASVAETSVAALSAACRSGLLWELQLALSVLENATFTNLLNEEALLQLQLQPQQLGQRLVGHNLQLMQSPHTDSQMMESPQEVGRIVLADGSNPPQAVALAAATIPMHQRPNQPGCTMEELPARPVIMCDPVQQQPPCSQGMTPFTASAAAASRNECVENPSQSDATLPTSMCGIPALPVSYNTVVSMLVHLLQATSPYVREHTSVRCVTQLSVALLMNLTHERADGAKQLLHAGGLQAVAELVRECCCGSTLPAVIARTNTFGQHSVDYEQTASCTGEPIKLASGLPITVGYTEHVSGACDLTSAEAACMRPMLEGKQAQPSTPPALLIADRQVLLGSLELLNVCLGLLINVSSKSPTVCLQLCGTVSGGSSIPEMSAQCKPATNAPHPSINTTHGGKVSPNMAACDLGVLPLPSPIAGINTSPQTAPTSQTWMIPLLASIVNVMDISIQKQQPASPTCASLAIAQFPQATAMQLSIDTPGLIKLSSHAEASARSAGGADPWPCNNSAVDVAASKHEVTAEQLAHEQDEDEHESDAEASIVAMYAAILLGFLIADDNARVQQACATLSSSNLSSVVSAIERCLLFYTSAGAITEGSKELMTVMLEKLKVVESCLT